MQFAMDSFLYSPKKAEIFNMIPNKHLSGGIVPVSLEEINGAIHIYIKNTCNTTLVISVYKESIRKLVKTLPAIFHCFHYSNNTVLVSRALEIHVSTVKTAILRTRNKCAWYSYSFYSDLDSTIKGE